MSKYSKAGSRELWRRIRWGLESMSRKEVTVYLDRRERRSRDWRFGELGQLV